MESHGLPGHIHISAATYDAIRDKDRFAIRERGVIAVKGKGDMRVGRVAGGRPTAECRVCTAAHVQGAVR